jgi:hypothetical protein
MNHSRLDDYLDHSDDLVARVRRAKEAAQRKMEEFGDPSEYEITIIHGRKKEEPVSESATQDSAAHPLLLESPVTNLANSDRKSPRSAVKNERTNIDPEFNATDARQKEED